MRSTTTTGTVLPIIVNLPSMITNKPNYNVCFSIEKLGHDIQPSTIPRANIIKHNIYYNEFYYILTLQGLVTLQSIQSSFLKTPTKPVK